MLWILTAKQEATRTNRLQKTIEMLLMKKKNPTEK
ncbi:YdeI/OmpD-associated family protein [Pedobacter sp. PWIIR3]